MNGLLTVTLLAQEGLPSVPGSTGIFDGMHSDARFGIVMAIVLGVTAAVIILGCVGWNMANSMHRRRLEADLKRDMLDRGMSADEISKVIEATPPQGLAERWVASKNK